MVVLFYVVLLVAVLGLLGAWLLLRRQKSVPLPAHSPKRTPEHFGVADTVLIPRVGPGENRHFVDFTAEMPAIRPDVPGRHHGRDA